VRFTTIWTIPAMSLTERLRRTRDWAAQEFAARLPKRIKYFVTLQQIGRATMTSPNIPATPLEDILRNLDAPKNIA
jgi:hypothetical protein